MTKIFIIVGDNTNAISKEIQQVYEHDHTINIMKNESGGKIDGKRIAKMNTVPSWKSSNLIEKINYRTTETSPFDIVIVGFWKSTLHILDLYSTYKLNPNVTFVFVKDTNADIYIQNHEEWQTFVQGKIAALETANNLQLAFQPTNSTNVFELTGEPAALAITPVVTTTSTIEISMLNCGQ